MSVVSDSPLLVAAAAGANTQAASTAPAAGGANEPRSFARVLQSEKTGVTISEEQAVRSEGQPGRHGGESLPVSGKNLPPSSVATSSPASAGFATASREAGPASRNALISAGSMRLMSAGGSFTGRAGIEGPGLESVTGETLPLSPGELPGPTVGAADAPAADQPVRPIIAPDPSADGDLEVAALQGQLSQVQLPGQIALSSAARAAVDAGNDPNARTAGVTLMPGAMSGSRQAKAGADLPQASGMRSSGEIQLRGNSAAAETPVFDPGVSQRAAAALQGADAGGRRGQADDGLKQLLAGVSLDRAGDAQRLELAMSARAGADSDADAEMLLASFQRATSDARQGGRISDTAAPIAGAGATSQPASAPDQPGRPAAMLSLLATPADPEFAPEFAGRLQMMVKNGVREASVQLHPAELGRLQLTVSTDGDQARIAIVAETPAARDMIEHSMPRLRDMLEQSGLQLAQGDVSQRQDGTGSGSAGAMWSENSPDAAQGSETTQGISISMAAPDRLLDAYV